MSFEIHKNVPMPTKKPGPGRRSGSSKYPYMEMEIGDCFYIPQTDGSPKRESIASMCADWSKRTGNKFEVYELTGDRLGIWRVPVDPEPETDDDVNALVGGDEDFADAFADEGEEDQTRSALGF